MRTCARVRVSVCMRSCRASVCVCVCGVWRVPWKVAELVRSRLENFIPLVTDRFAALAKNDFADTSRADAFNSLMVVVTTGTAVLRYTDPSLRATCDWMLSVLRAALLVRQQQLATPDIEELDFDGVASIFKNIRCFVARSPSDFPGFSKDGFDVVDKFLAAQREMPFVAQVYTAMQRAVQDPMEMWNQHTADFDTARARIAVLGDERLRRQMVWLEEIAALMKNTKNLEDLWGQATSKEKRGISEQWCALLTPVCRGIATQKGYLENQGQLQELFPVEDQRITKSPQRIRASRKVPRITRTFFRASTGQIWRDNLDFLVKAIGSWCPSWQPLRNSDDLLKDPSTLR